MELKSSLGLQAIELRVLFEKNKNVRDPRRVATLLREVEAESSKLAHPDPYRPVSSDFKAVSLLCLPYGPNHPHQSHCL